ncbi:hypothetical protein BKA66DRAFT_452248 [Pyrenochaeta sp. MPI-SDFR-AT-0127]|nr:hypothetical protein BKA66DRAFT_452248 [Pyrenochaeta sp. MPI-SDFR-AT-0127]
MGEGLIQRSWTKQRYPISLLFVCRQLHAETALLPYSLNEFYFISYERTASCFIKARKPAQIRALQKMRVGLYSEGDEEYDVPPGLYWNEQPGVHWAELFEIDF